MGVLLPIPSYMRALDEKGGPKKHDEQDSKCDSSGKIGRTATSSSSSSGGGRTQVMSVQLIDFNTILGRLARFRPCIEFIPGSPRVQA